MRGKPRGPLTGIASTRLTTDVPPAPDAFAQEMAQLEAELKRLELDYSQFFAGRQRRLPSERRARVDSTIRRHDRTPRRNTAERFRFDALQARYAALCQLWDRTLRARDEGREDDGKKK